MNHQTVSGWMLLSLLMSTLVLSYPQAAPASPGQIATQYIPRSAQQYAEQVHYQKNAEQFAPQVPHYRVHQTPPAHDRKFAEKPNALKKVALDDIDSDIQTNQLPDNLFSWTNMLGSVMQMLFNNAQLANKSDDIDNQIPPSPWTNIIAVGLKILTTVLGGGGAANDGIDKVDNGVSPMQNILAAVLSGVLGAKDPDQVNTMAKQAGEFINIVVNLLDALKTSFSHRSYAARSIGKKDSVSDFAVTSIAMLKGYMKTQKNDNLKCMEKYLCEANSECNKDTGGNSIFCQLGSYATSYVLERSTGNSFEKFQEAGRRGRSSEDCKTVYVECKEF